MDALYSGNNPTLILMGHSLGGAVAVEVARLLPCVAGLIVIDVAEGTALESLSAMQSVLRGRPNIFRSIDEAILWSHKSGMVYNLDAAKISMPGQIKK